MRKRIVTRPVAERMRRLRKRGKTISEVARRIGVHQTTVWAYCAPKGYRYREMR